jgi:hypothetical protein
VRLAPSTSLCTGSSAASALHWHAPLRAIPPQSAARCSSARRAAFALSDRLRC